MIVSIPEWVVNNHREKVNKLNIVEKIKLNSDIKKHLEKTFPRLSGMHKKNENPEPLIDGSINEMVINGILEEVL